jgi:hypothetical protein
MSTDCLVLFLEDSSNNTNLFIIYDNLNKSFFLCGKKVTVTDAKSFSFYCKHASHLQEFALLLIDSRINIHIYNFDDLPANCDEITFDSLNERRTNLSNIISYYEDPNYYEKLIKYMTLLKNVKNDYIEI